MRPVDPGERLEQRRFSGAVVPDQPEAIAVIELEGDLVERAHDDALVPVSLAPNEPAGAREQGLPQAAVSRPVNRKIDGDVVDDDRGQDATLTANRECDGESGHRAQR